MKISSHPCDGWRQTPGQLLLCTQNASLTECQRIEESFSLEMELGAKLLSRDPTLPGGL